MENNTTPHDPPPDGTPEAVTPETDNPGTDNGPQRPVWRRRPVLAAAALTMSVAGLAGYGVTASGALGANDPEPVEPIVAESDDVVTDCAPTPEDTAAMQAEQDALAAFLDERGVAYEREDLDEHGVRWVVWDEEDDAANLAVDEFYAQRYPMSPEELAAANAQEDALAAFLHERGIPHTRETDAYGMRVVVWDEEDEVAAEAVDEFYSQRYPEASEEITPEEVAQINAGEDALAAFLDERGIAYERETDEDGIRAVVVDAEDEAALQAMDEFARSQGTWSCVFTSSEFAIPESG